MRAIKPILFIACLLPFLRAVWIIASGEAVNPIEFALHSTGTWALVMLLLSLTITPLRQISGWNSLIRYRRMLGLYSFFYVALHFMIWIGVDNFFDWDSILKDIFRRPFITVGFGAFLILFALALTSTHAAMRRLKRNWGRLHRLVYPASILAVLHYWWLVKLDVTQPAIYTGILVLLLAWRLLRYFLTENDSGISR